MRTRELKRWMIQVAALTPAQRQQALARLQEGVEVDAVAAVLRSRPSPTECPKCLGPRIVCNGQADGLQRFKCRGCGASFNALTGTPLARLRHRNKWMLQAGVMDEGLSVRKAAARMQVHRTTAFRWRHRFLAVPRETKNSHLSGVVEADEAYVLRSYKGQRHRLLADGSRRPRHRGGHAAKRGLSSEQVPILVARNRAGLTTDFILGSGNKRGLIAVLPMALAIDAVLCTDGSAMLTSAARDLGIEHHGLNTLRGERTRGDWHIQNVNAYHSRFKAWMAHFIRSGDVVPAELPGLVPGTRPERAIRRQRRVTAGSGHFGMKPSSANANRAFFFIRFSIESCLRCSKFAVQQK